MATRIKWSTGIKIGNFSLPSSRSSPGRASRLHHRGIKIPTPKSSDSSLTLKSTPTSSEAHGRNWDASSLTVENQTKTFQHKNSGAVSLITWSSLTEKVLKWLRHKRNAGCLFWNTSRKSVTHWFFHSIYLEGLFPWEKLLNSFAACMVSLNKLRDEPKEPSASHLHWRYSMHLENDPSFIIV